MAKKSRTGGSAADFARRSNAVSRMNAAPRGGRPSRFEDIKMMGAYMGLDPSVSPRPMPRPDATERGSRFDEGMTREEMEAGSQAPARSMRPMPRSTQQFAEGGMVTGTGSRAQISGTKFSGTF